MTDLSSLIADTTKEWRCFHCGDVFTTERTARLHFGATECSAPACQIKAGAEMSMLEALRRAEDDAERATAAMHNESSEGWRAYHHVTTRLREQVEAAENLGYERGLRDGRQEHATLRDTINAVLTWAEQRCPCENETPDPCPLCGASVENLEACKSAENTIPHRLLATLRALDQKGSSNG